MHRKSTYKYRIQRNSLIHLNSSFTFMYNLTCPHFYYSFVLWFLLLHISFIFFGAAAVRSNFKTPCRAAFTSYVFDTDGKGGGNRTMLWRCAVPRRPAYPTFCLAASAGICCLPWAGWSPLIWTTGAWNESIFFYVGFSFLPSNSFLLTSVLLLPFYIPSIVHWTWNVSYINLSI